MRANITSNGVAKLTEDEATVHTSTTIHAPASIGTASITVGWLDSTGTFNAYDDGALIAGASAVFNTGTGVELVATIATVSTPFILITNPSNR